MARGRRYWFGLAAALLMAASLFLPLLETYGIANRVDPVGERPAFGPWRVTDLPPAALAAVIATNAAAITLAVVRPAWAWIPSLVWIVAASVGFLAVARGWRPRPPVQQAGEWITVTFVPLWSWFALLASGTCLFVASMLHRRRPRAQTDASVFD
jgi:hypothetical protein